ncbi:sodium:solute symporter family transporter [Leptospira ilyithenensis]|uniref:Sodium:solute symporter n=1 Tax=Leptospira ilyithenensis TaxID=2484901 RepID=A0A4V3JWY4_9LEPT|nr:sodium:solute symporter [Leptospira ilyithenensis]TGN09142.1 sodium:solute symporter [Leptospira ilyithenensis]
MNFILDFSVIVVYFIAVFYFGFHFSKKRSSEEDFYLAKREIHWVWLMFSLVATETSSLTFLSIPSLSMKGDFSFIQIAIGYILGRTAVAYLLLPKYYAGKTISIYAYLGEKFGKSSQKSMSGLFTISRVLGDGIRLYVTSLPIAFLLTKMGFSEYGESTLGITALFLLTFATILYSVYGGFRAIVFTDSLQLIIYLLGGFYAFYLLWNLLSAGGNPFPDVIATSLANGKLSVFHTNWLSTGDNAYYFIFAILGGAFISIGSHGTDLMLVQRVIASKNLKQGQKILIGSGVFVFFQFLLFLGIGTLLSGFYQGKTIAPDKAFSMFIVEEIPSPFLGLLLSAILASAMSSLSSTINSLSLTWARDWEMDRYLTPKILSLIFGVILFFSSLLPFFMGERLEKGILEVGLTIFSYTLGPTIALFIFAARGIKPRFPNWVVSVLLFGSILALIFLTREIALPFTLLIPTGILIFGSGWGLFHLFAVRK